VKSEGGSAFPRRSDGYYLVMVFQDWSKQHFKAWISYLQKIGEGVYVAVIPETGYYYTPRERRLVNAYYGFYSIEKRKAFIFKWVKGG